MPKTYFDPLVDGFAFVNSWQFDQAETDQIRKIFAAAVTTAVALLNPIFGAIVGLTGLGNTLAGWITNAASPGVYGLCGGMAFAALDYHKSGRMLPQGVGASDQPARDTGTGTALRDYLWQRQLDSLVPSAASQTLAYMAVLHLVPKEWPFSGGHRWLRNRSRQEWEVLKGHIDAGDPWPIGLVGTSGDPFDQHQVLAYGYDDPGDGTGRIYVYDPNCVLNNRAGSKPSTIDVDFTREMLVAAENCPGRRGSLRGFFCTNYALANPPDIGLQYSGLRKAPPAPPVFLVFGGAKFHIPSPAEFGALGYDWNWVRNDPFAPVLGAVPTDRTLLKERSDPRVFLILGGAKFHVPTPQELDALGFPWERVRAIPDGTLAQIPDRPRDGTLLRERSRPEVYVIRAGTKVHIPDPAAFDAAGFDWLAIRVAPNGALAGIPDGAWT